MRKHLWVLSALTLVFAFWSSVGHTEEVREKEWTFLLFLNGHNNLDSFGDMNMRQMKDIGSSDQVNIVVQWASERNKNTKRILVKKGSYQVDQDMAPVDMGNWQNLVEFARWGIQKYPAKKYFIAVWNHGGGWHRVLSNGTQITPQDISWDDISGNVITTEQLGLAMNEIAKIIGHKVDIYGSDACLMAMAEVAAEMKDSVEMFVGSEEVEPGEGWPYSTFLARWIAQPTASARDVSIMLTEEYFKAYNPGGIYPSRSVTFSALDLTKLGAFNAAVAHMGRELQNLDPQGIKAVLKIAKNTQDYTYGDYKDAGDFVARLNNANLLTNRQSLELVRGALSDLVVISKASPQYSGSTGVAMWIPTESWDWNSHSNRYRGLQFDRETNWSNFLTRFF